MSIGLGLWTHSLMTQNAPPLQDPKLLSKSALDVLFDSSLDDVEVRPSDMTATTPGKNEAIQDSPVPNQAKEEEFVKNDMQNAENGLILSPKHYILNIFLDSFVVVENESANSTTMHSSSNSLLNSFISLINKIKKPSAEKNDKVGSLIALILY
jgi:hypothetical protein